MRAMGAVNRVLMRLLFPALVLPRRRRLRGSVWRAIWVEVDWARSVWRVMDAIGGSVRDDSIGGVEFSAPTLVCGA